MKEDGTKNQPGELQSDTHLSPRIAAKHRARRELLLDTAMTIVNEGGLEALTMTRIAKQLKMAVGAPYRYFPGKQELLAALQFRTLGQFEVQFREDLQDVDRYLQQKGVCFAQDQHAALMRILIASHLYLYDVHRSPQRRRLLEVLLSPTDPFMSDDGALEVGHAIQRILSAVERLMLDAALCGAITAGAIEEAWQRTYNLWAQLQGLSLFRKRDRLQPPYLQVDVLFEKALRTLLTGWGAKPQAIEQAFALLQEYKKREKELATT